MDISNDRLADARIAETPKITRRAVLAAAIALAAAGPAFADDKAKAFLEGIYKAYAGPKGEGISLDKDADYRRYFSPALAKMIIDDNRAAQKRDDVPDLDGDPFVGHQDWEIKDVAVTVTDDAPDKATGTVTFINIGKPEKVVLSLVKASGNWRVDDVQWADGTTLRGIYKKK